MVGEVMGCDSSSQVVTIECIAMKQYGRKEFKTMTNKKTNKYNNKVNN